MCVCVSDSKKLEMELQALKDNNARLMDTLQEADSNAREEEQSDAEPGREQPAEEQGERVEKQRRSSASL